MVATAATAPGLGVAHIPIPTPEEIERRLYDLRLEAGLLRRLLRISQDRQILVKQVATREAANASR